MTKTFEELGVCAEIRRAIEEMGFAEPMPVQEAVIPSLLESRQDTIALAQTGTGKTAAFGIPLLQRINTSDRTTQALVLSPTRELCLQIADDLKDFSRYMGGIHIEAVYGGANIGQQIRALKNGAHIIVATPGRLLDLMNRGVAHLDEVRNIVLDEADEMLNMGFSEAINAVFEALPEEHSTLMFSATMSREVERIAPQVPARCPGDGRRQPQRGCREREPHLLYGTREGQVPGLKRIVDYNPRIFAIIFCRTKLETQEVADKLIRDGYNAEALHGDLSQQQRDLTMQKFRQHTVQLLVATDVAARGLDVDDLTHVINYGLPDDIENYTHRSGRTGRAGKKGTSISIVHTKEKFKIRNIEKVIGKEFVEADIPQAEEICKKQLYKVMDQIVKTDVNDDEIAPFIADINRYFEYIDKDEIIKKIVSLEFGKFLAYYADAPEIEKPVETSNKKGKGGKWQTDGGDKWQTDRQKMQNKAQKGYKRLFINLGKKDGFFPGVLMQTLNRYVGGRQEVGHIDLLDTFSYFDVPERDARKVASQLTGIRFKGRQVRCNDADDTTTKPEKRDYQPERRDYKAEKRIDKPEKRKKAPFHREQNDWRELMGKAPQRLKGEEPDFSEEGWARRRPKKKIILLYLQKL